MTYDDWKARDMTPEPERNWCETCGHAEGYCDCQCCTEQDEAICSLCCSNLSAVREADTPEADCSSCNPGFGR